MTVGSIVNEAIMTILKFKKKKISHAPQAKINDFHLLRKFCVQKIVASVVFCLLNLVLFVYFCL